MIDTAKINNFFHSLQGLSKNLMTGFLDKTVAMNQNGFIFAAEKHPVQAIASGQ